MSFLNRILRKSNMGDMFVFGTLVYVWASGLPFTWGRIAIIMAGGFAISFAQSIYILSCLNDDIKQMKASMAEALAQYLKEHPEAKIDDKDSDK